MTKQGKSPGFKATNFIQTFERRNFACTEGRKKDNQKSFGGVNSRRVPHPARRSALAWIASVCYSRAYEVEIPLRCASVRERSVVCLRRACALLAWNQLLADQLSDSYMANKNRSHTTSSLSSQSVIVCNAAVLEVLSPAWQSTSPFALICSCHSRFQACRSPPRACHVTHVRRGVPEAWVTKMKVQLHVVKKGTLCFWLFFFFFLKAKIDFTTNALTGWRLTCLPPPPAIPNPFRKLPVFSPNSKFTWTTKAMGQTQSDSFCELKLFFYILFLTIRPSCKRIQNF